MQHIIDASALDDRGERLGASLALLFGEAAARGLERVLPAEAGQGASLEALLTAALRQRKHRLMPRVAVPPEEWTALVLAQVARLPEPALAAILDVPVDEAGQLVQAARGRIAAETRPYGLVLEDDALCRGVLEQQCEACGFAVVASTARPEVAVACARLFDLKLAVIDIDIHGSELAGDLAAMQIRELTDRCHVLFVTGYPQADRIASLIDNASAVVKPFRTAELTAAIQHAR